MITQLSTKADLIEGQKLTPRGWRLMQDLVQLSILTGSGSPEGVVEAEITTLYMNTAGTAGSILYIKKLADISGDRKQGWILV